MKIIKFKGVTIKRIEETVLTSSHAISKQFGTDPRNFENMSHGQANHSSESREKRAEDYPIVITEHRGHSHNI